MKKIIKLKPNFMEKIWGYEKWILSTHKSGVSFIYDEEKNLLEYLGKEIPILIKEIKTNDFLSVQVHPYDDYAKKYENDNGKTECWYILDASDDAKLVCGIDSKLTREEFKKLIDNGEVHKSLKEISVKKGDMIYIPAGLVHAIGKNIKLVEIQQCSNVTYRIYDWGRDREIHVDKALDVIKFNEENYGGKIENFEILKTPYFTVEKLKIENLIKCKSENKFNIYFCIDGSGIISDECGNEIFIEKDESVYIDENISYSVNGNLQCLKIY